MQTCEYCAHAIEKDEPADYCRKLNLVIDPQARIVNIATALKCKNYVWIGRHIMSEHCWCKPALQMVCPTTGDKLWVHNDL